MPISIKCSHCQKALRVPDTAAGKKIRCPACKELVTVPALDDDLVEPDDDFVEPEPETAVTEKPTSSKAKDTAISETPGAGKKKKAAWDDKEDPDKPKSEDEGGYGVDEEDQVERKKRKKREKRRRSEAIEDDIDDRAEGRRNRMAPHRGVLILVLGIVSILCACLCALLGFIMASVTNNMATNDLLIMERKLMDPSGRPMVVAGQICAYIAILVGLAMCGLNGYFMYARRGMM